MFGFGVVFFFFFYMSRCAHLTKTTFLILGEAKPKFCAFLNPSIKRDMKKNPNVSFTPAVY